MIVGLIFIFKFQNGIIQQAMKTRFTLISLFFCSFLYGQDISHWEGHYSGSLTSQSSGGLSSTFHMELDISNIDDSTYNWVIIYGKDSLRQERKYLLKRTGRDNHFIIDEKNSILLDLTLIGNSFYSVFEIDGSIIHVEYQWQKKAIIFILSSAESKRETGNSVVDGDEIPLVYSYKTTTAQYAFLKREN